MLIWTARLSKKKAVCTIIILGILISALICVLSRPAPESQPEVPQLLTNEDRIAYLTSYGWE